MSPLLRNACSFLFVPAHQPERLTKALAQVTDCTSLQLESGKVTDTPALRNKARAQARQLQAEAIVANDPNVQFLQTTFGATIVPGSIRPV